MDLVGSSFERAAKKKKEYIMLQEAIAWQMLQNELAH